MQQGPGWPARGGRAHLVSKTKARARGAETGKGEQRGRVGGRLRLDENARQQSPGRLREERARGGGNGGQRWGTANGERRPARGPLPSLTFFLLVSRLSITRETSLWPEDCMQLSLVALLRSYPAHSLRQGEVQECSAGCAAAHRFARPFHNGNRFATRHDVATSITLPLLSSAKPDRPKSTRPYAEPRFRLCSVLRAAPSARPSSTQSSQPISR